MLEVLYRLAMQYSSIRSLPNEASAKLGLACILLPLSSRNQRASANPVKRKYSCTLRVSHHDKEYMLDPTSPRTSASSVEPLRWAGCVCYFPISGRSALVRR